MTGSFTRENLPETIVQIIVEQKPRTVTELANLVKDELCLPEQEIMNAILKLQNEGKITLIEQPRQDQAFRAYLQTTKALWFWLTTVAAITTAAIVFIVPEDFYPWVYVRNVLGVVFVLWFPGYTFVAALFPVELPIKTSQKSLDAIERIALSLGLSLALVPMIGLLLNYTPWGIRLVPLTLSLLTFVIVAAGIALLRERQIRAHANQS